MIYWYMLDCLIYLFDLNIFHVYLPISVHKFLQLTRFSLNLKYLLNWWSYWFQINLYLLSRILYGLAKLAVKRGYIPTPKRPVFPWFAAIVWGIVLWLFEYERNTLQPSLRSSMTYLYHDSNKWDSFKNFLIYNKWWWLYHKSCICVLYYLWTFYHDLYVKCNLLMYANVSFLYI